MTSFPRVLAVCALSFVSCRMTERDVPQPSVVRTTVTAQCARTTIALDAENHVWTSDDCETDTVNLRDRRATIPAADAVRAQIELVRAGVECTSTNSNGITYQAFTRNGEEVWERCETVDGEPWASLDAAFDAL